MKKQFAFILLLLSITNLLAQPKAFYFKPTWKVGDKKMLHIENHEVEFKNGVKTEDTIEIMDVPVQVLKEDKDHFYLKITYQNIVLNSVEKLYDGLKEELKNGHNLELIYKVNKSDGKSTLDNWKQAQSFLNNNFKQMMDLIKKKTPELAGFAKLTLKPVQDICASKESLESYFEDYVGFLTYPFGKKLTIGDSLIVIEKDKNPLSARNNDSLSCKHITYINNHNASKKTIDVHNDVIFDMNEFMALFKQMMEMMTKNLKIADSVREKRSKEMDDEFKNVKMEVTKTETINFDYSKSWPTKVVQVGKATMQEPKRSNEKTRTCTITVK